MAFEPLSSFYQKLLSGGLIIAIIAGLYFYSNSYVNLRPRGKRGFIEKTKRLPAPKWLLKFHNSNPSPVTYVNYWSYSCQPCLKELPFLVQLQQERLKNKNMEVKAKNEEEKSRNYGTYKVLLFNVDNGEEAKLAKYYLSTHFPNAESIYAHLPARNEALKAGALPYHQAIDKNKNIAIELIGEADSTTQSHIKDWLQILLQETKI